VSYDNHESVFDKAWFARDSGLAGLFYWQLGSDRVGERSLVRKGWETLNEVRAGHS
jgi:GH18 family chitinase